jgi:hypothetical protein
MLKSNDELLSSCYRIAKNILIFRELALTGWFIETNITIPGNREYWGYFFMF